jgi:hypothetical protein
VNWNLTKTCTTPVETSSKELKGTAFFISSAGHLLTCAHVGELAGGWDQVRIKGKPIKLIYVGSAKADDFAVLQLEAHDGSATLLSTSLNPMDRFLSIGFGRADFPSGASVDGTITDINPQADFSNLPMIRLRVLSDSQQIRAGFSGAPVFNAETDRVVGIIAAYDHAEGALAIPISTVLDKWPALASYLKDSAPNVAGTPANARRIFISYRSEDPDVTLAQHFYESLKGNGFRPFMAGESLRLGDEWPNRISTELAESDYFILLLSAKSASSDMVTEEVKRAKHLYDTRPQKRPRILPIRLNMELTEPLNYDLAGYLNRFQQKVWRSDADTLPLIAEIVEIIREDKEQRPPDRELPASALPQDSARPLPVAEPELPEGQVGIASQFYISRPPIEELCNKEIQKSGALIRIRAPRQMGKTSLLARILDHARTQQYLVIPISLQLMDGALINDLGKLLKWLSSLVSRKLRQPNTVEESWDDLLGHKSSATAYFEEYILPNTAKPVVLALDEIDRLFDNEQVAADFFGLLRGWHELSKDQAVWAKLRLIVVHSTEVYVSLGVKESPFNVGLSVRPPEFTPQQLEELANRHGYPLSPSVCAELLRLVGGHPFLSRVALYAFAKGEMSPAVFFKTASTEEGRYSDHLRRHLWNLEQNPSLLRAMRTILAADHQPVRIDAMEAFKLESMGLVTRHGNGVTVRYELYANYLRDRLEGRN